MLLAIAVGLVATIAEAGTTSRAECAANCAVLIAQCSTTCGVFANLNSGCRRGILKRCQREGVTICAPPTTSTVTTTTAVASSTTHATTTTHAPTTTTTAPSGLSCAAPRPLTIGTTVTGDTGSGSDHGPGVGCMQNSEAPDLVYVAVPPADGTLVVSLTSEWDGGVYVRTTCDDPATELACTDQLGGNATEVLQLSVTGGTTYYLYVDGYTSDAYGSYELTSELQ
jgi:hypothetical protein